MEAPGDSIAADDDGGGGGSLVALGLSVLGRAWSTGLGLRILPTALVERA